MGPKIPLVLYILWLKDGGRERMQSVSQYVWYVKMPFPPSLDLQDTYLSTEDFNILRGISQTYDHTQTQMHTHTQMQTSTPNAPIYSVRDIWDMLPGGFGKDNLSV